MFYFLLNTGYNSLILSFFFITCSISPLNHFKRIEENILWGTGLLAYGSSSHKLIHGFKKKRCILMFIINMRGRTTNSQIAIIIIMHIKNMGIFAPRRKHSQTNNTNKHVIKKNINSITRSCHIVIFILRQGELCLNVLLIYQYLF